MPVQIDIAEQKFFNQFLNGDSFSTNTSEFTSNLAGSVLEKIKFTQKVQVQWFAFSQDSDPWTIETTRFIRSNGSFIEDGFSIGDTFDHYRDWSTGSPTLDFSGTVTAISDDGLRLTFTVDSGTVTTGTDEKDVGFRGTNDITALIYKFGLIENDEPLNFISKVSGNEQAYYAVDIGKDVGSGRPTTFVNMTALGQYNDWVTGSAKVRYVQDVGDSQEFEIEHIFRINPFYVDGELNNLKNNIIPDLLDGLKSLKYVYELEFRTAISNPNTAKTVQRESNLGSVAWFNENFNGFDSDYTLESITYKNTSTAASLGAIEIGTNTTVTITISRDSGNFSAGERIGGFVSLLPSESGYTDKTTDLDTNFLLDQKYNTIGAAAASSDFIKNFQISLDSGNAVVSFEVDYSTAQQALITSNDNYLIAVQVGDESLSAGNSDRVMILADTRSYEQDADIAGLMSVSKFDMFPHEYTKGIDTPFTDLIQWNEDGALIDGTFSIDLSKNAFINDLFFLVIAYKSATEEYFELDRYTFEISDAVVSGGVQQFNINTTRDYILKSGDQFNQVVLSVGTKTGDNQAYNFTIGQKISWQEWIKNLDADTVFYDNTETNDNLNYKSSNYSGSNGYQIKFALLANVAGTDSLGRSGNTNYLFISPDITVNDYDEDGQVTPDWSGVIQTFNNETSADLGGAVLSGTDTLFRITWTHSGGSVSSAADFYGIHRIEETGQTGYDIYELSTLRDRPDDNLLKPLSGETHLKKYISGGKLITECLIDGSLIEEGREFNLSGKIGDPLPAGFATAKLTEDSVIKNTEDDDIKQLD